MNAIVLGLTQDHAHNLLCKNSFIQGYESTGSEYNGTVDVYEDRSLTEAYARAESNGSKIIIWSYAGATNPAYQNMASQHKDVLLVMPTGGWTSELVFTPNIPASICVTGVGATQNLAGYKIEFFDIDPTGDNLPSFSNAYIAGKIAGIADYHKCNIAHARTIAQYSGSLSNNKTDRDGFGIININKAKTAVLFDKIASYFYK